MQFTSHFPLRLTRSMMKSWLRTLTPAFGSSATWICASFGYEKSIFIGAYLIASTGYGMTAMLPVFQDFSDWPCLICSVTSVYAFGRFLRATAVWMNCARDLGRLGRQLRPSPGRPSDRRPAGWSAASRVLVPVFDHL